jgi:diaminobutyrate-2-oxoglutarate transaminase
MIGVEFVDPKGGMDQMGRPLACGDIAALVQQKCFEKKLVMERGGRNGSVMRCLCALTVSREEIAIMLDIFEQVVLQVNANALR